MLKRCKISCLLFFMIGFTSPHLAFAGDEKSPAQNFFQNGGCYKRIYSKTHLGKYPDQTVKEISFSYPRLRKPISSGGEYLLSPQLNALFRGEENSFAKNMKCSFDDSNMDKVTCHGECGGGKFDATFSDEGKLTVDFRNGKAIDENVVLDGACPWYRPWSRSLGDAKDDKVFNLMKLPDDQCAYQGVVDNPLPDEEDVIYSHEDLPAFFVTNGCYARQYSKAQLDEHSEQTVEFVSFQNQRFSANDYSASERIFSGQFIISFAGDDADYMSKFACFTDDAKVYKNAGHCEMDCDHGRFNYKFEKNGALLLDFSEAGSAALDFSSKILDPKGSDERAECSYYVKRFSPTHKEDYYFKLYPSAKEHCIFDYVKPKPDKE